MAEEKKAYFGMGCFWQPEYNFSKVPGVKKTRVGYSGGNKENPTYQDLGNHTETLEVTYDPDKISYDELLKKFWSEHNPTEKHKDQYKSVIFVNDDEQREKAMQSLKDVQTDLAEPVATEVMPLEKFNEAEDYHQQYVAKQKGEV